MGMGFEEKRCCIYNTLAVLLDAEPACALSWVLRSRYVGLVVVGPAQP